MHTSTRYSLRSEQSAATLHGCNVEVSGDGTAMVIVDGERLFRFDTLGALLSQYGLLQGELTLA